MNEWTDALNLLLNWNRSAAPPGAWTRRSLIVAGASLAILGPLYGISMAARTGSASGTDACGHARVTPAVPPYQGPIDVTAIAHDSRTPAIAAMLGNYFAAVADNRPDDVFALFDPDNRLNPVTPQRRRAFAAAMAGDVDSNVQLLRLTPACPGPGPVAVDLTHTRAPRDPSADASTVCWRGVYRLSPSTRGYRIVSIRRSPGRCTPAS